jgi:hypothetical protein
MNEKLTKAIRRFVKEEMGRNPHINPNKRYKELKQMVKTGDYKHEGFDRWRYPAVSNRVLIRV